MATTAQNNVVFKGPVLGYNILTDGTGTDINQGDQLYLDTTAHVAKPLGSSDDTNAAHFIGVALESSAINPYGTKKYSAQIAVGIGGVFTFNTTSGDTYNEGDALYVGVDAQTVTNTVGGLTKKIGFVKMRPGQSAVAGGTGVTIDVEVSPQYPVVTI